MKHQERRLGINGQQNPVMPFVGSLLPSPPPVGICCLLVYVLPALGLYNRSKGKQTFLSLQAKGVLHGINNGSSVQQATLHHLQSYPTLSYPDWKASSLHSRLYSNPVQRSYLSLIPGKLSPPLEQNLDNQDRSKTYLLLN